MNKLTTHDVECLITEIVGKKGPIEYMNLSTILFIIESFFHSHNKDLPIDFSLTHEGLFSNELEYFIYRMKEKEKIEIMYESVPQIYLKTREELRIAEECLRDKYEIVFDKIKTLLEEDFHNEDFIQLAKVIRAYNILSFGIIEKKDLEHRFKIEKINLDKVKKITETLDLREVNEILV